MYVCMCVCICMYVCMYVYMYVRMYISTYVFVLCVCMHAWCIYVCRVHNSSWRLALGQAFYSGDQIITFIYYCLPSIYIMYLILS